ncbi:hypothetical protein Bbelb_403710 [Branchiostoma belcheri]|nr:hypothetical protein Bbelb_403710 [Branchiostoma belcheri]
MEQRHRDLLRAKRREIIRDLRFRDIRHRLVENKILTSTHLDDIEIEPSRQRQAEALLDILPTRGPNAFAVFRDALKHDYPHLAMILRDDGQEGTTTDKGSRVFIIHAGEDKESFVRPLVTNLQQQGVAEKDIFFDEMSITPGEAVRERIISTLSSQSLELAVIVVSTSLLNKHYWPKLEFETCLRNNKPILPIWVYDNNDNFKAFSELVGKYSPTLKQMRARRVQRDRVTDELPNIAAEIVLRLSTLPPETEACLDHEISKPEVQLQCHKKPLREKLSSDWKDLAFHLGFGQADIDNIDGRNQDDKSRCMDLLEEWLKSNGERATIQVLMKALTEANLQSVVDGLKQELVELKSPVLPMRVHLGLSQREAIENRIQELERQLFIPDDVLSPRLVQEHFSKARQAMRKLVKGTHSHLGVNGYLGGVRKIVGKESAVNQPAPGGSSREGHQEEKQKEKIRQAEQKLVQLQHHTEAQEAMVHSLQAEVSGLRDKEKQAEQKLVQLQHHNELQEDMVHSLRAEVIRLRDKEEKAQKVLLDHKMEIQQLQEANVAMATRVDDLLQDNEKLRSQVVLLGGEQHAHEQTTQELERTILMFTENVLQKFRQSKPTIEESELATAAESQLLTKLSCRLGSDWRRLGAGLGIPQPRLDSIQAAYNSALQRACTVLMVWIWGGDHGLPHDLKQLETVLKDMDRADLLDIVKIAYKDYIKEMPEVEVEPDSSVDEQGITTWSVQLPGRGKFLCKHTDLGVVTPCPVQLTYRTVNPSGHWPESEDWELIGPLFHIQCNHGDDVPVELLLPHILDLSQEDGSALTTNDVRAMQIVAGNTTLHSADVTPTHFVTRHQKGSLWGSVLQRLRALSVNRRGLFTLFKTSQTPHGVDVKAHIVSNTKGMVETLQEDLSKLHPRFYPWDSLPCSFRPHKIYCLQASVENGTLAHAEPQPPGGLEYEDTLDRDRIYPSFHLTVQRSNPGTDHLQHLSMTLQLYPQSEVSNIICSCTRYLDYGAAMEQRRSDDVSKHFFFIKENVSVHWKDLAHLLDFTRSDIDTIHYKPANRDAKECCMDMLEQWLTRKGDAATLQVLLQALTEAGLQDTVDQLNAMSG